MNTISNFWQNMLEIYGQPWYNKTPNEGMGSSSPPSVSLLQEDFTMRSSFEYNQTEAKIQGLSVQVGELFADLWKAGSLESADALEAYKSLRRLLPTEEKWDGSSRHIGATAAHKATQGVV